MLLFYKIWATYAITVIMLGLFMDYSSYKFDCEGTTIAYTVFIPVPFIFLRFVWTGQLL